MYQLPQMILDMIKNMRHDCRRLKSVKKYFVHDSLNIQSNSMKFSQILGIAVLKWVSWSKS